MIKYIDQSKVNDEIVRVLEHTDCKDEYIDSVLRAIESLPTIEVSEDCSDYYKGYCARYEDGCFHQCEDCISREHLLSKVYDMDNDNLVVDIKDIENAPSVEPSRAEGEWVGYEIPSECSVCGHHWDEYVSGQELWHDGSVPNYCPNCGAKMRG